jgi:4-amino-4-deoxy-L-arabinose transferase-like glycosyltransferase
MPILLLFLSFLFTLAFLGILHGSEKGGIRVAFLKCAVLHGIAIIILTEILSSVKLLAFAAVAAFWLIATLCNGGLLLLIYKRNRVVDYGWQNLTSMRSNSRITGAVSLVLLITLITALIAPPNNWDVMDYHLPRVMHWLQNRTVAHYPTSDIRQIAFMPGASYIVAQLQLLSGGDHFANLVQWIGFIGSILGVSLISEELSNQTTAWLSTIVCASIPMAIMQSMTAQNDLITAFWLVCFTYFLLCQNCRSNWFWISASLSLAIVTKPTAWIFSLPLLVILAIRLYRQTRKRRGSQTRSWLQSILLTLFLGLTGLSLAIPSFWRNFQTFGSAIGADGNTRNTVLGFISLCSNLLKNLALSLPIPGMWQFLDWVHTHVLIISIDTSNLNFSPTPVHTLNTNLLEIIAKVIAPHEDFVGYPVHLGLAILSIGGGITTMRSRQHDWRLMALAVANLINFILFCLLLKWQPWGNRLLLPLFILNVPIVADYLATQLTKRYQTLIGVGLTIMAIIYALTPIRHPLVALPPISKEQSPSILTLKREDIYFSGAQKELKAPYTQVANLISRKDCTNIGLALGGNSWEYSLWVLLNRQKHHKLAYIKVQNPSNKMSPELVPQDLCALISVNHLDQPEASGNHSWKRFLISDSPFIQLNVRSNR